MKTSSKFKVQSSERGIKALKHLRIYALTLSLSLSLSLSWGQVPGINSGVPFVESLAANGLLDGLVACWELDETSGTTAFDAHGSNDATNSGATINQTGILDKAYDVRTSDLITTPYTGMPSTITFSIWFYIDAYTSSNRLFVKMASGLDTYDCYYSSRHLRFFMQQTGGFIGWEVSPPPFVVDVWHHLVITYSYVSPTTPPVVYFDGAPFTPILYINTGSGIVQNITAPFYLGNNTNLNRVLNGLIDQTGVWNRALTATEVEALYNLGNGILYTSFTAFLKPLYEQLIPFNYEPLEIETPYRIAS